MLTKSEKEVLVLVREGLTDVEVAASRGVSPRTINFHMNNIVRRLGAKNRTHAVVLAVRQGIIPLHA